MPLPESSPTETSATWRQPLEEVYRWAVTPTERTREALQREVVAELYTYSRRSYRKAWWVWLVTGIFGGHRFYLQKTGTGIVMLFTVSFGGIWWLIDLFRLRKLVNAYNDEQARREAAQEPPLGLDFLPLLDLDALNQPPSWFDAAKVRPIGYVGDALVLIFAAYLLGNVTWNTGTWAALAGALSVILVANFAEFLFRYHHLPFFYELAKWEYKLRLFYHYNRPGAAWRLITRPILGLFTAPFSKSARAEVKLYGQLGGAFVLLFTFINLFWGGMLASFLSEGIGGVMEGWMKGMAIGFATTYAFATPVGATLSKHLLTRRSPHVLRLLSILTLALIATGLLAAWLR